MNLPREHRSVSRRHQAGGVTIMVALMLLVFFTIIAVGMSRNSFREVVITGTERQGAMVRNQADSGIEWSIFWLNPENQSQATANTSKLLIDLKKDLILNPSKRGKLYSKVDTRFKKLAPPTALVDTTFTYGDASSESSFVIGMMNMGKLQIMDRSQEVEQGGFRPATGEFNRNAPDLWALRSQAALSYGSGINKLSFQHAKEAWISTRVE